MQILSINLLCYLHSITIAILFLLNCAITSGATSVEESSALHQKAFSDNNGVSVPLGVLLWAEEFDKSLDLTTSTHIGKWRPNDQWQDVNLGYSDFGGDSWNINPNQHPLHSPFLVADGVLTIKARKTPEAIVPDIKALAESGKAPKWSGGILITDLLQHSFKYGYFEIRARLPNPGKGMLPAIWLYVSDGRYLNDKRKSGAEIDILEVIGHDRGSPWSITVHRRDWLGIGDQTEVGTFENDTTEWHTYGLDWQPTYLRFYRDGMMVGEVTGADASWFDIEMSIRLNHSVDGNHVDKLGNLSDQTTPEIMMMQIDYVRVYADFKPQSETRASPQYH